MSAGGEPRDPDSRSDHPETVDREQVIERIGRALEDRPPVGVLLIEVDDGRPVPGPSSPIDSAVQVVSRTADHDRMLSYRRGLLVIVRCPLGAPAEAEALARRVADELERHHDQLGHWAIGVATSRQGDRGRDLLRYAEHALDDAQVLGGHRVVPFDDVDRELLAPEREPAPDPGGETASGAGFDLDQPR